MNRGASIRRALDTTLALSAMLLVLCPASAASFELLLEHKWEEMPIPIWVNPNGAPDMGPGASPEEVVLQAIALWEAIPTANVTFQYMGTTDAGWGLDGKNVVVWVSDTWKWQEAAAGATWWFPPAQEVSREVDLELNAVKYEWVVGGGSAVQSTIVDPVSVVAHELGHWLGISHSTDPYATMYFALLPNALQSTLSPDDKAAASTLYPSGVLAQCQVDADCAADAVTGAEGRCVVVGPLSLCGERHDLTGDFCSEDHINCEGMCWTGFADCNSICMFTAFDYSAGYCSTLCQDHSDCPEGYLCQTVPKYEIQVCKQGALPPVDETPVELAEAVEMADVVTSDLDAVAHDLNSPDSIGHDELMDSSPFEQGGGEAVWPDTTADAASSDLSRVDGVVQEDTGPVSPNGGANSGCTHLTGARPAPEACLLLLLVLLIVASRSRIPNVQA